MSRNGRMNWPGAGKTMSKPFEGPAPYGFYFDGHDIPQGTQLKAYETKNFGWVILAQPLRRRTILKE